MSYRIQTSTFVVECDHASEVANLVAALFSRDEDETAEIVDRDPAPKVTAKPGPKAGAVKAAPKTAPAMRAGPRIVSCATCPGHFPAPSKFGPAPKYCPACRAAGKTEDGPKSTAFKDNVAIGAQR